MAKAFTFILFTLFLLLASSVMTQTNSTTDQLSLLSLKSQIISDPSHLLNENWSPVVCVSHWVGVTCGSRHQRVNSLNLSNIALTGKIPREFGNLSFLVSLDLGSNNFHGNMPQEMTRSSRLKFLDVSVNNFSRELPSWFGFLHQLQALNLGNNSFTENEFDGPIHSEIGRLSNLQILELGTNHFTGIIPQEIGNLVNLVDLGMEDNQITGSVPISPLQILSAWQNNLSGFLPWEIGLTMMQILQLSYNKLIGTHIIKWGVCVERNSRNFRFLRLSVGVNPRIV
ncbi:hypothetical protein P3S68_002890 [Capsicum galapagoense]